MMVVWSMGEIWMFIKGRQFFSRLMVGRFVWIEHVLFWKRSDGYVE